MTKTLDAWIEYIQTLHAREIDLSLDRVNEVHQRLRPEGVSFKLITVAGTNGKGSTCELLASIYNAAGYTTGKYTSPHIQLFNERFSINRNNVSDQELLEVFNRVELARKETKLTYFEFGTLVAIELFCDNDVDIAILEVGLGGRLDAVNILDSDAAIITSVSIDHTDWLGDTIEQISREKIAVSRPMKPCILGVSEPPQIMLDYCNEYNVPNYIVGRDFQFEYQADSHVWNWVNSQKKIENLPLPFLQSGVQLNNASTALQVIYCLDDKMRVPIEAIHQGLRDVKLIARCQIVTKEPFIIVDVAHNQASVARLAEFIEDLNVQGKIHAICGMLKDKQIEQSLAHLAGTIDEWHFVDINNTRGSKASYLASALESQITDLTLTDKPVANLCYDNVESAFFNVNKVLKNDDALIVFGSFFVVSDIMQIISSDNLLDV